jgi:hypothetical protein
VGLEAVIMFFVDDGNIAATFDVMLRAIQFVETEGPKYGYILKKNKGSYMLGKCADNDTALQRKNALVAMGFSPGIIHIHPDNIAEEEAAKLCAREYGANILGSYIGHDKYIRAQLHAKAVELTRLGEQLVSLPSHQTVLLLFRYCYCPMINHLMRTISPRLIRFLTKQFEYCKREILSAIFGYSATGNGIPPEVFEWAQFSLSQGGLGLGHTQLAKHAAFAASFSTSLLTMKTFVPDTEALLDAGELPYFADMKATFAQIRILSNMPDDGSLQRTMLQHGGNCNKLQESLAKPMSQLRHTAMRDGPQIPIETRAWMVSISQYEASAWLDAMPKTADFTISNKDFHCMLSYRYLLPQAGIPYGTRCTCARRPTLDARGHHAITGCKSGGGRQNTHDSLKRCLSAAFKYAGAQCREEEVGVFRAAYPECNKVPDITLYPGTLFPCVAVMDVSVTCPLPGAELTNAQELTRALAGQQGRAANARIAKKNGKYQVIARNNHMDFLPIIFESTGYMDGVVTGLIDRVAEYASETRCIPKEVIYKYWVKRLSVTQQKALCTAMFRKVLAATNKGHGGVGHLEAISVVDMETVHVSNARM